MLTGGQWVRATITVMLCAAFGLSCATVRQLVAPDYLDGAPVAFKLLWFAGPGH